MIAYSICNLKTDLSEPLILGFSVWARKSPKEYLSIYPKVVREIRKNIGVKKILLYALVDNVWPRVVFSRKIEEQQEISDDYLTLLKLGFDKVVFVSDFVKEDNLMTCLNDTQDVTLSEFWKLLPKSKKEGLGNLTLVEILGFLWQVFVLRKAFAKFRISGLLAGIRSEFFHLTARKLLPSHNLYFVNVL